MSKITREQDVLANLGLTNVLANTPAIPFGSYSGGVLIVPASYSSTLMTVYTCADESGTYVPLKAADGSSVTFPVTSSTAVVLPATCFPCRFIKLLASADDSTRPATLIRKG